MMMGSVALPPSTPSHQEMAALFSLLDIIANEQKYRALLDELLRVIDEAHTAIHKLDDLQQKHAAVEAERAGNAALAAAAKQRIEAADSKLAADRAAHNAEVEKHLAEVEKHKQAVAAFEAEKARHADKLAEVERVRKSFNA